MKVKIGNLTFQGSVWRVIPGLLCHRRSSCAARIMLLQCYCLFVFASVFFRVLVRACACCCCDFVFGGFQVRPEELKDMDNMRKRCPLEVCLRCTKTLTRWNRSFHMASCRSGCASATRSRSKFLPQRIFTTRLRTRSPRVIVPAARLQYSTRQMLRIS